MRYEVSSGEEQEFSSFSHINTSYRGDGSPFFHIPTRCLEISRFPQQEPQGLTTLSKRHPHPLYNQTPVQRPLAMLKQGILGMGNGMAYSLERLAWNRGRRGEGKRAPFTSLSVNYY